MHGHFEKDAQVDRQFHVALHHAPGAEGKGSYAKDIKEREHFVPENCEQNQEPKVRKNSDRKADIEGCLVSFFVFIQARGGCLKTL